MALGSSARLIGQRGNGYSMSARRRPTKTDLARFAEFIRSLPLGAEAEMRPDGTVRVLRGGDGRPSPEEEARLAEQERALCRGRHYSRRSSRASGTG